MARGNLLLCCKVQCTFKLLLVIYIIDLKIAETIPIAEMVSQPFIEDDLSLNKYAIKSSCHESLCLTRGCIRAAHNLYESIDFNADPCEDFFEFVCGNWNKNHIIPEELNSFSHFSQLQNRLQLALKNILENVKHNDYPPFVKAANLYNACMNEDSINELKGSPLMDLINKITGGWPVLMGKDWQENNFDLTNVLADSQRYGGSYLISFFISPDLKNNNLTVLAIDQTSVGLINEYLMDDSYMKERNAYLQYIIDVAELLNQKKLSEEQKVEIQQILNFEKNLVKILSLREDRRNTTRFYNPMTVKAIQEKYKNVIDFETFFNRILANDTILKPDETIIVIEVEYFTRLGELLKITPIRVISNYVAWRTAQEFNGHLSVEFHEVRLKYLKVLTGATKNAERWRSCVDYTNSQLGLSTGKLYVETYFNENAKTSIDLLIKDVRDAFQEILENTDWMDPITKEYALLKLKNMENKIGYPESYSRPKEMEKIYASLQISPDHHFQNKLNLLEFQTKFVIESLAKAIDKSKWPTGPAVINAFNDMRKNSIVFPAAFLQPPFFDPDRPRSMNYGAIGKIIGHEITHGFDDRGKQLSADGNIHQWWSESAEQNFQSKAKCMVEQYQNYFVPEVNLTLNGFNTLGENIADNGGLKEAFLAYKKAVALYGDEPLLPGLDFNHDQLFFLSFAYSLCGIDRKERLKYQILKASHPPNKYRVNGVLSNFPEFHKTFKCSPDSRMYSKNPCSVW